MKTSFRLNRTPLQAGFVTVNVCDGRTLTQIQVRLALNYWVERKVFEFFK
jgi:hypothetical protein